MSLRNLKLFLIIFFISVAIFPLPYRYGCGGGPGPLDELSLCQGWKFFGILNMIRNPNIFEKQSLILVILGSAVVAGIGTTVYRKMATRSQS